MISQDFRKGLFIEVALTITAACILITLMIPNYSGANRKAKIKTTKKKIQAISYALEKYKINYGSYPSTLKRLKEQKQNITAKLLRDSWNSKLHYLYPGNFNPNSFDLISPGYDKVLYTKDDILNKS